MTYFSATSPLRENIVEYCNKYGATVSHCENSNGDLEYVIHLRDDKPYSQHVPIGLIFVVVGDVIHPLGMAPSVTRRVSTVPNYLIDDNGEIKSTVSVEYAYDGTVLSLVYSSDETWALVTSRGIRANEIRWMGNDTYQSIVEGHLNMKSLDKDASYIIGFSHPAHHLLHNRLATTSWLVSAIYKAVDRQHLNHKIQPPRNNSGEVINSAQCDERVVSTITKINKNALDDYIRTDNRAHCGYVFRYIDRNNRNKRPTPCTVLVESALMVHMRTVFYDINKSSKGKLNYGNRLEYMITRAFVLSRSNISSAIINSSGNARAIQILKILHVILDKSVKKCLETLSLPPNSKAADRDTALVKYITAKMRANDVKYHDPNAESMCADMAKEPALVDMWVRELAAAKLELLD